MKLMPRPFLYKMGPLYLTSGIIGRFQSLWGRGESRNPTKVHFGLIYGTLGDPFFQGRGQGAGYPPNPTIEPFRPSKVLLMLSKAKISHFWGNLLMLKFFDFPLSEMTDFYSKISDKFCSNKFRDVLCIDTTLSLP